MSTLTLLDPRLAASRTQINGHVSKAFGFPNLPLRKIDWVTSRRDVPLKVICLGLSRTGTFSLYTALTILGYKPYHMAEIISDAPIALPLMEEALEAKHQGRPYGREEFDRWLGRHDALVELPSHLFPDELLEAYPDAKVIINDRDVEGWVKSIAATVGEVTSWRSWPYIAWAEPTVVGPWWSAIQALNKDMHYTSTLDPAESHKAVKAWNDHYTHVRELCKERKDPKDVLMRFQAKDGWAPLCELLGKEVPDMPYPNVNDKSSFVALHADMWYTALRAALWKVGGGIVVGGTLAWGLWRLQENPAFAIDRVREFVRSG